MGCRLEKAQSLQLCKLETITHKNTSKILYNSDPKGGRPNAKICLHTPTAFSVVGQELALESI
jgi:hypothetical protein